MGKSIIDCKLWNADTNACVDIICKDGWVARFPKQLLEQKNVTLQQIFSESKREPVISFTGIDLDQVLPICKYVETGDAQYEHLLNYEAKVYSYVDCNGRQKVKITKIKFEPPIQRLEKLSTTLKTISIDQLDIFRNIMKEFPVTTKSSSIGPLVPKYYKTLYPNITKRLLDSRRSKTVKRLKKKQPEKIRQNRVNSNLF